MSATTRQPCATTTPALPIGGRSSRNTRPHLWWLRPGVPRSATCSPHAIRFLSAFQSSPFHTDALGDTLDQIPRRDRVSVDLGRGAFNRRRHPGADRFHQIGARKRSFVDAGGGVADQGVHVEPASMCGLAAPPAGLRPRRQNPVGRWPTTVLTRPRQVLGLGRPYRLLRGRQLRRRRASLVVDDQILLLPTPVVGWRVATRP